MNYQIPPSDSNQDTTPPPTQPEQPPRTTATPTRIPVKLPNQKPYVTYSLLVITIAIYLAQMGTNYWLDIDLPAALGVKVNHLIAQGQLWRLVTPMLLHGSGLHIAFNMYALYRIGPRLERFYGHWRYLALYVLSGFGGNVFSMMFTEAPSLGSSTAIFWLIGAQGVFFYHNREVFGPAFRQALNSIISIALINLFIGLSPGIDNWGHVGGLIGGVVFAWLGGPMLEVTGVYPDMSLDDQREPNEILQATGITALFFVVLTIGALYLRQ